MTNTSPWETTEMSIGDNPVLWAGKRGIQHYADFKGRASRQEYFCWAIANFLFVLAFLALMILAESEALETIFGFAILALFIPNLAVTWRRLHDLDYPGAVALIFPAYWFVAAWPTLTGNALPEAFTLVMMLVVVVVGFVLWVLKGNDGPNQFGPVPETWRPAKALPPSTKQAAADAGRGYLKSDSVNLSVPRTSRVVTDKRAAEATAAREAAKARSDDRFFEIAGTEILGGRPDPATWARAMALAGPDPESVKQKYVQLRVANLRVPPEPDAGPDRTGILDLASTTFRAIAEGKATARAHRLSEEFLGVALPQEVAADGFKYAERMADTFSVEEMAVEYVNSYGRYLKRDYEAHSEADKELTRQRFTKAAMCISQLQKSGVRFDHLTLVPFLDHASAFGADASAIERTW